MVLGQLSGALIKEYNIGRGIAQGEKTSEPQIAADEDDFADEIQGTGP
jgi:hypothetical protein